MRHLRGVNVRAKRKIEKQRCTHDNFHPSDIFQSSIANPKNINLMPIIIGMGIVLKRERSIKRNPTVMQNVER
jgi:hypothetical protein